MNELFVKKILLDRERLESAVLAQSESYIKAIPAVRHLDSLTLDTPVTFFAGENGTGKSTLIEAIAVACGFNAEGGSKNFNF